MPNSKTNGLEPFFRKLRRGCGISHEDESVLTQALGQATRRVGAHQDLLRIGEKADSMKLVLEGFACRYKILPDGRRQIVAYLLPGDICDLHVTILGAMDHNIGTLTPCTLLDVPHSAIQELTQASNTVARALWWCTLVDEAILREWLVNIGQRTAIERIAHLFCELLVRMRVVGLTDGDSCDMPLTQQELGDTLGLSTVHVNRVLQELRSSDLIELRNKRLSIRDLPALGALGQFNPLYLHIREARPEAMPAR
jgi:CRP-like cAMP-binding protein